MEKDYGFRVYYDLIEGVMLEILGEESTNKIMGTIRGLPDSMIENKLHTILLVTLVKEVRALNASLRKKENGSQEAKQAHQAIHINTTPVNRNSV